MINYDDTIAAIATPPGRGAIGIVRVSGKQAISIVDKIFFPARGKKLAERKSHSLIFGKIKDGNSIIDEALVGIMRSPNSFSGEDTVEIYCHGGNVILQNTLALLINSGARLAEPGEFTRRAFINGKIDLTQAEAVADLINAPTELARRAAVVQLEGKLKEPLEQIKNSLIEIITEIEAEIEFPDDVESEQTEYETLIKKLNSVCGQATELLKNADTGRILHDGFRVAIAGKPNAGKSSLLNRLAKEERALVTDIPGTTRDTLEVDVNIEGFPVRFIDTAGLRSAKGKIEQQGIERAKKTIESSDIVIWVCDISKKIFSIKSLLPDKLKKNIIIALNKCDLEEKISPAVYSELKEKYKCVKISAMTGSGIDELHNILAAKLKKKKFIAEDDVVLLRVRHVNLLKKTIKLIKNSVENLKTKMLPELIVFDLRDALKAVGEITGDVTTEDLLDKIFSDFCIGK